MFYTAKSDLHGLSEQERKNLLGGKGAGLFDMSVMGIKVPPFVIIPTSAWASYSKSPKSFMKSLEKEVKAMISEVSKEFGYTPLVSVRSGARVSCPGMMDTILNVGLDNKTRNGWEARIGETCTVDSFKRLVMMYGNVVDGIPRKDLEKPTVPEALASYLRLSGHEFPDANVQLLNSIEAVFRSWNNDRAKTYRKLNNIPDDWGTAVVIQAMVFGNMNGNSGTGVLFTRDPDNGQNKVVGEFLINAQGEDVVAGTASPMKLTALDTWNHAVSVELLATVSTLETLKKDVQDVEFTIQDSVLYILQTRTAKRSAMAALKIANDMVNEKLITLDEALSRVTDKELDLADQPVIDPKFIKPPDFMGNPACSGVVTGNVCLSSTDAVNLSKIGVKTILVSEETTPDDIAGMNASVGILTMTGGSTSHAAVVARSMNRVCIVGLGQEHYSKFKAGTPISLDGATGRVWFGQIPVVGGNNPLVGILRGARVGGTTLLVTRAPAFAVDSLCLQIGNLLHLSNTEIEKVVNACKAKCKTLSLAYTKGESAVFMTEDDLEERRNWVCGLINGGAVVTYGFGSGPNSHPVRTLSSLSELVMLSSNDLLQSIAQNWTPEQEKVVNWLKKDGVEVNIWNTKGSNSPVSYSVLCE